MSDPIRTSAGNGVVGVAPRRFLPGKRGSLWIVDRHSHQPSGRVAGVVDGEFSLDVAPVASVARVIDGRV